MPAKFVNVDRDTVMMFLPDLRDWLPENSMVHFVIEAVEMLDLEKFQTNERGSGSPQYPPSMTGQTHLNSQYFSKIVIVPPCS